jgi:hypothetical protein
MMPTDQKNAKPLVHKLIVDDNFQIWLQKLTLNAELFRNHFKNIKDAQILKFNILNNKTVEFTAPKFKLTAEWLLLGTYYKTNDTYTWVWPWKQFTDKKNEPIQKALTNLPKGLKMLDNPIVQFKDEMLVSIIFAFLTQEMEFEHIYANPIGDGKFAAIGLVNIHRILP